MGAQRRRPAAWQILGSPLVKVEGMGTYACRNIVGTKRIGDRRSGHALANAVDVGGFVLKDGRRITLLGDWYSSDPQIRQFWTVIRASACKRFGTVLSPTIMRRTATTCIWRTTPRIFAGSAWACDRLHHPK